MVMRENSTVVGRGRRARRRKGEGAVVRVRCGGADGRKRLTGRLARGCRLLMSSTTTARGAASAVSIRSSRNKCALAFATRSTRAVAAGDRRARVMMMRSRRESRYRKVDKVDET